MLYRSIFDVVRDFLQDEALEGQDRMLKKYLKPDLLINDDMGMKNLPKRSGEFLFGIIMRRYETRATMMTSNRPLEDWGKLIGDVPSATAILDRFLHHATVIAITGRSYRLRNQTPAADEHQPDSASENPKPAKAPPGSKAKTKPGSKPETALTCPFKSQYRRTRRELFPILSRVQNIGYELGENDLTAEWYRKNHRAPWVAWCPNSMEFTVHGACRTSLC